MSTTNSKTTTQNPDEPKKDVDQEKAKAFIKPMTKFFGAAKTKLKIRYLVAMLLSKYVPCSTKQEIIRFCVEYIKGFHKTVDGSIAQMSMKDAVNACNEINAAIDLSKFTFNKIIVSDE